jgi:hypothetical protein
MVKGLQGCSQVEGRAQSPAAHLQQPGLLLEQRVALHLQRLAAGAGAGKRGGVSDVAKRRRGPECFETRLPRRI